MKKVLILLGLMLGSGAVATRAQKLVIGSRVPDLKGVAWSTLPPRTEAPMLIEFYAPDNASSARFFPKLAEIQHRHGNGNRGIQIVVLTRGVAATTLDSLRARYGERYFIGSDPDGRVYRAFHVQYVPYTILVNSKGELYWQGNLGNLPMSTLEGVR
ncbi:hypothetical protein [uncultured Rikenella sp.]|uniref:TlpA family protein disulfide reductase n=1 Tax=uncultured Rikenella sp. TaxID=368003 RepID=UPI002609ACAA|nr:hypothetical protein [uncultured Rikenella sp.]